MRQVSTKFENEGRKEHLMRKGKQAWNRSVRRCGPYYPLYTALCNNNNNNNNTLFIPQTMAEPLSIFLENNMGFTLGWNKWQKNCPIIHKLYTVDLIHK